MRQPSDGDEPAPPPVEPTPPTRPIDPADPTGRADPTGPDAPAAPSAPGAPSTPAAPSTPGVPVELGDRAVPVELGDPTAAGESAPPGYGPGPGQPGLGLAGPGGFHPGQPGPGEAVPAGHPPTTGSVALPKKRRGLVIASIALAATLLLCLVGGGSAILVLRAAERGEGAADPVAAVHDFLTAVYTDRDVDRAAGLVCSAARDGDEIAAKIQEVADSARAYDTARFRWVKPKVDEQTAERALVSTKLTMTTGDERVVDQQLTFIVIEETGWWVCDVI